MDLTKNYPRSPKQKMDGIVSLARMTDKARAFNEGTLGEYHYDCPHDKPVLAFLGVDAATFAAKVAELKDDAAIERWVRDAFIAKKTTAEIDAFNRDRTNWKPEPGSESETYFKQLHDEVAKDRPDVTTWFKLLDLDEKRAA